MKGVASSQCRSERAEMAVHSEQAMRSAPVIKRFGVYSRYLLANAPNRAYQLFFCPPTKYHLGITASFFGSSYGEALEGL